MKFFKIISEGRIYEINTSHVVGLQRSEGSCFLLLSYKAIQLDDDNFTLDQLRKLILTAE